jgi:branched-chain amino acid transport system ATP-binding protein
MSDLLSVRGLSVSYGPISAVRNVSLKVGEGEIVALLGPNGAGKTSVLRGVTALVRPASGRVRMAGQRVDDPARAVTAPRRAPAAAGRSAVGRRAADARHRPGLDERAPPLAH